MLFLLTVALFLAPLLLLLRDCTATLRHRLQIEDAIRPDVLFRGRAQDDSVGGLRVHIIFFKIFLHVFVMLYVWEIDVYEVVTRRREIKRFCVLVLLLVLITELGQVLPNCLCVGRLVVQTKFACVAASPVLAM